ncbi:MAG: undecaprenyldiphospho-muramoylpentapeptide beta-N-acetylglucosaminyltransferase [Pseudomonadota bacterium]|nr:undecaprenyldiphospho-muramoylpentapeptide beta-N-acetylglucosaminyltransferase [Pseudomonadota bacterium]
MSSKSIILAAGGSGGHVFPAQAIAENFLSKHWSVVFISDSRGIEFSKTFPPAVSKFSLGLKNPRSGGVFGFLISIFLIVRGLFTVLKLYFKIRPNVVVGFGGYPSVPALIAAMILRIPIAIHEQNTILGSVNSLFRNKAFFIGFGIEPPKMPNVRGKAAVTGNPIRESLLSVTPLSYGGLKEDIIKILIIGGSQGATFISTTGCKAICELPSVLKARVEVYHQCRLEENYEVKNEYTNSGVLASTKPFFTNIEELLNTSHLVICRAGASTLTELCLFGRPSLIIPLPSSSKNHQVFNAKFMEKNGASVVLYQSETTSELLSVEIANFIKDRKLRALMAQSALNLSNRGAGQIFAEKIIRKIDGIVYEK